jgi:hypothetical protein
VSCTVQRVVFVGDATLKSSEFRKIKKINIDNFEFYKFASKIAITFDLIELESSTLEQNTRLDPLYQYTPEKTI